MPRPVPYAIYCRRSQERDERQQQSLEDQQKIAYRTRDNLGLSVVEEITESVSAKEPHQRPGFARLLQLVEKGTIGGIIAWHPDRLSRNEIDAAALTYLIRKGKLVDLQFGNYTFDNSPEGIMMLQMALSQSQYYSSKLAKDVKRGMESKVEKGWFPHRAPEGYRNARRVEQYSEVRIVEKDEERFGTIRAFWDLILSGAYTVPQATRILNEEWGYTTKGGRVRGGGPLSRGSAYKLLKNPFYTGHFVVNGVTYKGLHGPMVTADEFNRVQAFLRRSGKQQPKKHLFAYTGLIRCANCGCMVTASLQHGVYKPGRYVYYHCNNGRRICSKESITERELEGQLEALLRRIAIDPRVADYALSVITRWQQDQEKQGNGPSAVKEQQGLALADAERKLDTLLDLRLRNLIADDQFADKQARLLEEMARVKASLDQNAATRERVHSSAVNALQFLSSAHQRFLVGTVFERREIVQALGASYAFLHKKVSIELHPALGVYLILQNGHRPKWARSNMSIRALRDQKRPSLARQSLVVDQKTRLSKSSSASSRRLRLSLN